MNLNTKTFASGYLIVGRIESGDDRAGRLPLSIDVTAEIARTKADLTQELVLLLCEAHRHKSRGGDLPLSATTTESLGLTILSTLCLRTTRPKSKGSVKGHETERRRSTK